ncbi:MAG TPA: anthranilate synthase component I, partial [Thermoanaerobaculia bacterium]
VARAFVCDSLTPVTLLARMRRSGAECFLLESVAGGESVARYTFLGCAPIARLSIDGAAVHQERAGQRLPAGSDPLRALEQLVTANRFEPDPELPPLSAGAVGYLGYDAVRTFETIPDRHPRDGAMPDGVFLLFDAVVAFDHPRQRLLLLTNVAVDAPQEKERQVDAAIVRLDRLEAFLTASDQEIEAPRAVSAEEDPGSRESFAPIMPKERFLAAVERAREAILAGDAYQIVLSQRWTSPLEVDPFDVYRALRMLNPSPYLFYLETRDGTIFGASPEMLVRCRGGVAETRPIAGTARRGKSHSEDEALASALLADPKERAEHVMLVDLARNDLGRVCAIGSVEVPRYAVIERYSHVQHIVSEVKGKLAPGRTSADVLAACFPAGTLTGAPKIRAMELIDELEACRRGVYGGVAGYLDAAGNLDMAIAIRTAVVEKGICRVQAGAGIVADSVAEKEYAEAESKAAALFRAIDLARSWSKESTRHSRIPDRKSQVSR